MNMDMDMDTIVFREIVVDDYHAGYMDLLFEFSKVEKRVSIDEFSAYIEERRHVRIFVAHDGTRIVGAGTIFTIDKLHNRPVGQIEDVIITESYRGNGIGKRIIDELVEIGLNEMKCYKVVLNCIDKNIGFYEKCGFQRAGSQMRK
jgi:glucosamine-phosphate N-acetyltransferase